MFFKRYTIRTYERVALTRNGKLTRIIGPGRRWIWFWQKIERKFNIRTKLWEMNIGRIFLNGSSAGITFRFRCRFDPEQVAGRDREKRSSFIFCPDKERRELIETKLKLVIGECVNEITKNRVINSDSSFFDRISPILTGVPDNSRLIEMLQPKLANILESVGMVLDADYPITIHNLELSPKDIENEVLKREVATWKQQFGSLSQDRIAQLITARESKQPLRGINANLTINGEDKDVLDPNIAQFLSSVSS